MKGIWRLVFLIYNLVLFIIAGFVMLAALGRPEPMNYMQQVLSTPQNRILLGVVAIVIMVLTVILLFNALKIKPATEKSVVISGDLQGQISITVPAIKVMIMRAVQQVKGVKEVKPSVFNAANGVVIKLHVLINPEYSVPQMSENLQNVVKKQLEEYGGLNVAEVKVLIDDFGVANKPSSI